MIRLKVQKAVFVVSWDTLTLASYKPEEIGGKSLAIPCLFGVPGLTRHVVQEITEYIGLQDLYWLSVRRVIFSTIECGRRS